MAYYQSSFSCNSRMMFRSLFFFTAFKICFDSILFIHRFIFRLRNKSLLFSTFNLSILKATICEESFSVYALGLQYYYCYSYLWSVTYIFLDFTHLFSLLLLSEDAYVSDMTFFLLFGVTIETFAHPAVVLLANVGLGTKCDDY